MKEYIEPQIEIIEYRLVDVIASSQPQLNNNGSETGNEFEVDKSRQSRNQYTRLYRPHW